MRSEKQQRIVYAYVSATGVISPANSSTDCSASKISTGNYKIRFNPPFKGAYTATVTPYNNVGCFAVNGGGMNPGDLDIKTFNLAGAATDIAFSVIAVGI